MTQKEALDILKLGHNVFLTGSAGSGKTFLLNQYIDYLKNKKVEVGITASTGVAATHMNGITIHSWSGMGIKEELTKKDIDGLLKKSRLKKRFGKTKVLIIDEVSMLHHFQLDLVDKICKLFKQNDRPFGGMQVVLCGDLFQLPPVAKNNQAVYFVNRSDIWRDMNLNVCYITEQHRHSDNELTTILNDMRADNTGEHTLAPLRKRYRGNIQENLITKLYTHNIDVDEINRRELEKLKEKREKYDMEFKGNKKLGEVLKKFCLAPEQLVVKRGAIVMFVKNDQEGKYVNGTLGKVAGFSFDGLPIVKTFQGKRIFVSPRSWTIEEDGKVLAEVSQIPLRLAWAITVHKSQGMTLDTAEIDLSKSFVEGMGYVALSRVRTLGGLRLMGLNGIALKVNKEVLILDKELMKVSETVSFVLRKMPYSEKEKRQKEFLRSVSPKEKEKEKTLTTYEKTKLLVEQKLSILEIAKRRQKTEGTILGHLEKMIECGEKLDLKYLQSSLSCGRFEKIKTAFEKSKDLKLSPVKTILGHNYSFEEVRFVRLFLDRS